MTASYSKLFHTCEVLLGEQGIDRVNSQGYSSKPLRHSLHATAAQQAFDSHQRTNDRNGSNVPMQVQRVARTWVSPLFEDDTWTLASFLLALSKCFGTYTVISAVPHALWFSFASKIEEHVGYYFSGNRCPRKTGLSTR